MKKRLLVLALVFTMLIPSSNAFATGKSKSVTRAEIVRTINDTLKLKRNTKITFPDVKSHQWFYGDIGKGVKAGYINGYSDGTFKPNKSVTKKEALIIFSRAFKLDNEDINKGKIPNWANGIFSNNNLDKELTEKELKNLISKTISTTIVKQGTYSKNIDSSIIITIGNVTLKDMEVKGNVIISENVNKKDINFNNVKVHGKIIVNNANLHFTGENEIGELHIGENVRTNMEGKNNINFLYIDGFSYTEMDYNTHVKKSISNNGDSNLFCWGRIDSFIANYEMKYINKYFTISPNVEVFIDGICIQEKNPNRKVTLIPSLEREVFITLETSIENGGFLRLMNIERYVNGIKDKHYESIGGYTYPLDDECKKLQIKYLPVDYTDEKYKLSLKDPNNEIINMQFGETVMNFRVILEEKANITLNNYNFTVERYINNKKDTSFSHEHCIPYYSPELNEYYIPYRLPLKKGYVYKLQYDNTKPIYIKGEENPKIIEKVE